MGLNYWLQILLKKICFFLLLPIFPLIVSFRPQELILFTSQNYTGGQKSFFEPHFNLKSDSIGKAAKSHCVVRGLWRIMGTFPTGNNKTQTRFIENIYSTEEKGKICGTWGDNAEYLSILSVGAQDLDTPAIQFHSSTRFYGVPTLFLDGRVLRLPTPMNFSSFGFTGKHNWTIFKNTDLSWKSECLVANLDTGGNSGVTFSVNRSITVGSIFRGCGALDPKALGRKVLENGGVRQGQPDPEKLTVVTVLLGCGLSAMISRIFMQ